MTANGFVLRTVISESRVNFRTILGAISVYLIFGLQFTSLYVAIDRLQDGPFFQGGGGSETGDFIFFSFTTLTTTGYGNLIPGGQPGKMFAGLEMLLGQIFLVTLIAGLVTLWRPRRRSAVAAPGSLRVRKRDRDERAHRRGEDSDRSHVGSRRPHQDRREQRRAERRLQDDRRPGRDARPRSPACSRSPGGSPPPRPPSAVADRDRREHGPPRKPAPSDSA